MKSFITIIKLDYLQRSRSYAFLITLCASLAIAYTFVPEPNAGYSTIRIEDHVGYYNAAWFGYITAIMTSIFLSLIGFYLVNSGVKKDIDTKVGQIIATTRINDFTYLLSKVCSNFLLLLTITLLVFLMSILLFFLYNDGFPFKLLPFLKPYIIITVPALFLVSVLAVIFEIIFRRYSVVQNVIYFFIFSVLMVYSPKTEDQFSLDVFGSKIVIHQLENTVKNITNTNENLDLSIGYVLGNTKKANKFLFEGVDFPTSFIISRFIWIALGVLMIFIVSALFHRFNIKERISIKKNPGFTIKTNSIKDIDISKLPVAETNYNILPLFKTEFLLLLKKGKKWFWIITIIGMLLLAILPINLAHQLVLPILWFLQVNRLSDLTTKEVQNNIQYFTFTAYNPIKRLLSAQFLSGVIIMIILALPLVIRLVISSNFIAVMAILLGSIFIVLLSAALGLLSNGKKLFEVIFFMLTYANINAIGFVDYFGALEHNNFYLVKLAMFIILLLTTCILIRMHQLKR